MKYELKNLIDRLKSSGEWQKITAYIEGMKDNVISDTIGKADLSMNEFDVMKGTLIGLDMVINVDSDINRMIKFEEDRVSRSR